MVRGVWRSIVQALDGVTGKERRRLQRLKDSLKETTLERNRLKHQIKLQANELKTQAEQHTKVLRDWEQRQADWQSHGQAQLQEQQAQFQRQLWDLQLQLQTQAETHAHSQAELQAQCDSWREQCDSWREQCGRLEGDRLQLQTQLEDSQAAQADLQARYTATRQDCDRLQQENQELVQLAEEETLLLESENQRLQQEQQELLQWVAQLQRQVMGLQGNGLQSHSDLVGDSAGSDGPASSDLSHLRLALVGGHQSTRRGVIQELSQNYGVAHVVELEPFSQESTALNKVRAKLSNCDWIFIITGYLSHKETKTVSVLKDRGAISGRVYLIKSRGRSGVVREILAHIIGESGLEPVL